jgi:pimeloyl-ACP methyl ester carboxylesterase
VLAGHSLAREELSSVGSRHPERVAGLIYVEAGYSYAYYDRSRGDLGIDLADLEKKLEQLQHGKGPQDPRHLIEELLATTLPGFERDLKEMQKNLPEAGSAQPAPAQVPPIAQAIMTGMQKYANIRVPVLAIYAVPHATGQPFKDYAARAAADQRTRLPLAHKRRHLKAACHPRGSLDYRTRITTYSSRTRRRMCCAR